MARKRGRPIKGYAGSLKDTENYGFVLGEPIREEETDQAVSCWRKAFYGTEAKARLAAQRDKVLNAQEPYPCPYCRGWHLAKVKKGKRRRGKS